MSWLRLVLWATLAIIVAYTVHFIWRLVFLATRQPASITSAFANSRWRLKIFPYILLIMLNLATQLQPIARWILLLHVVLILSYVPMQSYMTPLKSLLIKLYSPKIIRQQTDLHASECDNDWNAVKLIAIGPMLRQFWQQRPHYVALLTIPDLQMFVPIADYTNNAVYLFGGGMLKPQRLDSNAHITIGAHNLGNHSHELFSPLAREQLVLQGMKVLVASLEIVKEYEITGVRVVKDTDVQAAMAGATQTITLMTCTDDNQRRILVQASLCQQYDLQEADDALRQRVLKMR